MTNSNEMLGIGLRNSHSRQLVTQLPQEIECLELAPENYIKSGGVYFENLKILAEHYPIVVHGLALSLGSTQEFDINYLGDIKKFLKTVRAEWMSDHLSYSSLLGVQTHDLFPLPFTKEAVRHVVGRIRQLQDFFEMPFAIENISYYATVTENEMTEWQFISEVLEAADCKLLLDVNNVFVNSRNHNYDPYEFLKNIPLDRSIHIHIAGHKVLDEYILDTHGAAIIDPVWELLDYVVQRVQLKAIIIERDNNIPELNELLAELRYARERIGQARSHKDQT